MVENRSKKHHYRPVAHLKLFCGADDKLWIYDRHHRYEPRRVSPEAVGYETFLYAANLSDSEPRSDVFEKWLAQEIDGPAAEPLATVATGKLQLNDDARSAIARFVVAQEVRTPGMRDYFLAEAQRALNRAAPELHRAALTEVHGREPTADELAGPRLFFAPKEELWLDLIEGRIAKQGSYVYDLHWHIIEAPDPLQWIANDIGLVQFAQSFDEPPPVGKYPAFGALQFLMPVGPRFALAMTTDSAPSKVTSPTQWIKRMNRHLVLSAVNNVFSRDHMPFVESNWRRHGAGKRQSARPVVSPFA